MKKDDCPINYPWKNSSTLSCLKYLATNNSRYFVIKKVITLTNNFTLHNPDSRKTVDKYVKRQNNCEDFNLINGNFKLIFENCHYTEN